MNGIWNSLSSIDPLEGTESGQQGSPLEPSSRATAAVTIGICLCDMEKDKLRSIKYVRVPQGLRLETDSFTINPDIMLPVQLAPGSTRLREEDITEESILAGMLSVIAYDEANPDFQYYREFVRAADPTIAERLNEAAIAKEQQKDYQFAEELFLAVYHLLPQSASCINLATLYSYMAVDARDKKKDDDEDEYLSRARHTLLDGLRRFGEDERILAEISSFEAYMGNLEEAKEYLERYMAVAEEGEKKQEMKKLLSRISFQLENDEDIKAAYDFMMLGEPEKTIEITNGFVEKNPKVWNGYFLRAWALRKTGRYEDAKKDLLKCIELGEASSDIYNELSICELEGGDRMLAKTYLETAADLDPENLTVVSNLSYLYLSDKEYDEAREYLEKARFLSGDDRIVKELIEEYEKATGEKIGEMIHEEIVHNDEEDDDAYQEEIAEIMKDAPPEEHECTCGHHHHDHGCGCGCHHEEER